MEYFFDNYRFDKWVNKYGVDYSNAEAHNDITILCVYLEFKASREEIIYFIENFNDFFYFNEKKLVFRNLRVSLGGLSENSEIIKYGKKLILQLLTSFIRNKNSVYIPGLFIKVIDQPINITRAVFYAQADIEDSMIFYNKIRGEKNYEDISQILTALQKNKKEDIQKYKEYILRDISHFIKKERHNKNFMYCLKKTLETFELSVDDKKQLYATAVSAIFNNKNDASEQHLFLNDIKKAVPLDSEQKQEVQMHIGSLVVDY